MNLENKHNNKLERLGFSFERSGVHIFVCWNPNLNDGVLTNLRPVLSVQDIGKRGADVLRDKPKGLHWKKDRGRDVPSAPWYELGLPYGIKIGDQINDHHLSLTEKLAAREKAK